MAAALAAFNGSGTQGTAAICKMHTPDDGDVQSVFWNRHDTTRFLLFGSSINEIPTSGGQTVGFGGNQIFTVNNDLDCLGDIYAQIELSNTKGSHSSLFGTTGASSDHDATFAKPIANLAPWGLARFISRIEFMVGTQIWQTMESNDLLNVLSTEMDTDAYEQLAFQVNGNYTSSGPKTRMDPNRGIYAGETVMASIKLPLLSKTLAPPLSRFADMTEDGYLMAAAPHQQVKIRLTYASTTDHVFERVNLYSADLSAAPTEVVNAKTDFRWAVKLYGKQQIMCNAERQQLKNMHLGLPKRIKMTQHAHAQVKMTKDTTASAIDLDHFSLYASYLVVSVRDLKPSYLGFDADVSAEQAADTGNMAQNPGRDDDPYGLSTEWTKDAHVHALTSSTVGKLAKIWNAPVLGGCNVTTNLPVARNLLTTTGGVAGSRVATGTIAEAELILNSSSLSGVLPGQFLTGSAAESMGLYSNLWTEGRRLSFPDSGFFIFPLASHAYDASAVPLNRFDNIRLRLKPTSDGATSECHVSVTCVGETTALYKGGAASLAMY